MGCGRLPRFLDGAAVDGRGKIEFAGEFAIEDADCGDRRRVDDLIDTATESMAYYVVQVDKFLERYETLVTDKSEAECAPVGLRKRLRLRMSFLAHGRAIRAERDVAAREGRDPKLIALINSWGGVTAGLPAADD